MNMQEWQQQVFDCPNMNPTAVAICLAIGSHGNWSEDQEVWPSRERISAMTGASRDNVSKYMTALEEQGWLKVTAVMKNNVRKYKLAKPEVVVVYGILAVRQRGSSSKLKNQVVVDDSQVVVDYDKQVVVVNGQVVVDYDTNLPRTYQENLQEELTKTSTTDKSAVHLEEVSSLRKEEVPMSTFNRVDQLESVLVGTRYLPNLKKDQKDLIRDRCLDRTWMPDEPRPNFRTQAAIKEVLG